MSIGSSFRQLWTTVSPKSIEPRWTIKEASFSQEGEDRLVARMLEVLGISVRRHRGFYVDVGAHHPTRFSNTYYWYLRGWSGINIDARPGAMADFERLRSRDTNLEYGIAAIAGELEFFIFDEPALNTFDPTVAAERRKNTRFRLVDKKVVQTRPLADVLSEHLPQGQTIDLLTVDVEGLDLEVLKSNDWSRFRPLLVLAESCDLGDLTMAADCDVSRYLITQGYVPTSKLVHTLCFARKDALPGF